MEIAAFKTFYKNGSGATLEYFVATNYGLAHFKFTMVGERRTISVSSELRQEGYLRNKTMQDLKSHPFFFKMKKRAELAHSRVEDIPAYHIDIFEKTTNIKTMIQNDPKAVNVWANITGTTVGIEFQEIIAAAETQAASERKEREALKRELLIQTDDRYGMF